MKRKVNSTFDPNISFRTSLLYVKVKKDGKWKDFLDIPTQVMNTIKSTLILLISVLCSVHSFAQKLNPGVERWEIKTSTEHHARHDTMALSTLLNLPSPIRNRNEAPQNERIENKVDGLKEGDMVTVTGYLHLVAMEDDPKKHRDGDYHMQLRTSSEWGDTCLIIEVPFPTFVSDHSLSKKCEEVRDMVDNHILKHKEPSKKGNALPKGVKVMVTGQLFFDATHLNGKTRGKLGMHSYTCWEIHPVTVMKLVK